MIYIITGVCGSGKTLIGKSLSDSLQIPFFDGDDFHAPDMVEKMRQGIPLNDADREPWLRSLANHIRSWEENGGAVLACSALKEKYRKILRSIGEDELTWILLSGTKQLIEGRMRKRKDHYMNPGLVDSQFAALEVPEYGLKIDVSVSPSDIVQNILEQLSGNQKANM